jgi:uncharacterized protein YecE (DUF72 family)
MGALDRKGICNFCKPTGWTGPILFQLPPNFHANPKRLLSFLKLLPKRCRYSFEFRHPSWYTSEIFALGLAKDQNCAAMIAEADRKGTGRTSHFNEAQTAALW